eukprot:TRINITY_DN39436_c0_g1_i1.p1 TRINITY_DN39436_c0_g1~~TRINITY_DN39436_c0_g1_i1.p1  ORF type:complete len:165 (-),score=26.58 TRINITY_DN39436_c0_g1_i1:14-457(-)
MTPSLLTSSTKPKDSDTLQFKSTKKKKTYVKCRVAFLFPGAVRLEASFLARETLNDIYAFIREYIADPTASFDLFMTPPRTVIPKTEVSIEDFELVPSVLLHITNNISPKSGLPIQKLVSEEKSTLELEKPRKKSTSSFKSPKWFKM